jgi:hypothetical protein
MKLEEQLFEKIQHVNLADWNVLVEAQGTTVVYKGVAIEKWPRTQGPKYDVKIFEHKRPTAKVHDVATVSGDNPWAIKYEQIVTFHRERDKQRREADMLKCLEYKLKELP